MIGKSKEQDMTAYIPASIIAQVAKNIGDAIMKNMVSEIKKYERIPPHR